jgi:hypothetical protein
MALAGHVSRAMMERYSHIRMEAKRRALDDLSGTNFAPVAQNWAQFFWLHPCSFESEEIVLEKLRERLRRMTDEELIRLGKDVRRLAENPFQRQLEEARAEWKRRKKRSEHIG